MDKFERFNIMRVILLVKKSSMKSLKYLFFSPIVFMSCKDKADQTQASSDEKINSTAVINHSAFDSTFYIYNNLQNSFVETDSSAIRLYATQLFEKMQAKSPSAAKQLSAIIDAKNIDAMRKAFSRFNDEMIASKAFGTASKTYVLQCPMAFNDTITASWLSDSRVINNPYLGKKHPKYKAGMLHCGEVVDSFEVK